ncbi:glycosyltransferase [Rhodobacteraceae bacterium R_SAG10]|nr:glycosyltransferase [Rhodobacteraceae bacterium R_SAG10]
MGGFSVYVRKNAKTNGRRFVEALTRCLSEDASFVPYQGGDNGQHANVILFNVSAPFSEILRARLRRKKVVLRVDGLYFDRLSPGFLKKLSPFWRGFITLGRSLFGGRFPAEDLANFVNQNYGVMGKIFLSHHLIYQSNWCQQKYKRYFPKKPYDIIVNGAAYREVETVSQAADPDEIKLVTIYNEWKPAKRMVELFDFVTWAQKKSSVRIVLSVLGYTGNLPYGAPEEMKKFIEGSSRFRLYPSFQEFKGVAEEVLRSSDMYITLTTDDPCPNVVVEALAHDLPVVAPNSGGLPDIVGQAGVLLELEDAVELPYFRASRFETEFPKIEKQKILDAIQKVHRNLPAFREAAKERVLTVTGINGVANRYRDVLIRLL